MKKFSFFFSLFILASATYFSACNNSSSNSTTKTVTDTKVTDIQPTSKSAAALASFHEGMASLDIGDVKNARASFTKAIEQDPQFGMAYLMRANVAASAKQFADDIAKGKVNLDSASTWEKMYADFQATNLTDDRNKGIEIAQKMATENPDAARAQADLGNAYTGNNQFDKAREAFQKAIQLNPAWVGGYTGLTNSYLFFEPKDLKKAEDNALKIAAMAPKSAGAQIVLGDVYRAQNDFNKAKAAYTKGVELNTEAPEAYYKLGHANTYLGNLEEARKNYADGGMHDITKTGSVLNTAYTYLYGGDQKASIKYLMNEMTKMDAMGAKESVANEKNNMLTTIAAIAMHIGDAATLKQVEPMIKATSDQITKDLGNTDEAKVFAVADTLHWQAMIAMAEAKYDNAKANEESMKAVLSPLKDDRKLEGYYADMGMINMKEKKYTDAISNFEKADPNSIYNKYQLAKANEAAGNKEKAMVLYKEVAAYNFNDVGNALVRSEVKKKIATP
ncbi:MAG: tetratricopeptide repeat protein [Ferruginibacter sp.]